MYAANFTLLSGDCHPAETYLYKWKTSWKAFKHLFCPHPTAVYTRLKHDMMESKTRLQKKTARVESHEIKLSLSGAKTNMAPPIIKLALLTTSRELIQQGVVMTSLCL